MPLSRAQCLVKLRQLGQERRRLLSRLTRADELAVGSVSPVQRKCGNPSCHCAEGPGHLQVLFLFQDERGDRRCKLVRRADEARLLRAGERYRDFRDGLQRLRAMDRREKEILMALRGLRALRYE